MRSTHFGPGLSLLLGLTLASGNAGAAVAKKRAATPARPATGASASKARPVAVKPAAPTGTVKMPYDEFSLALIAWSGTEMITATGKDGMAPVKVGNYWLAGWSVRSKDADGHVWRAEGGSQGQAQMALRITNGSTAEFRVATPLRTTFTVDQVDDQFAFLVRYSSTIGDHCSRVFRDDEPPPVPKLKIVDAEGAVVENIDLKWGCGFLCRRSWQAPAGVKWPLKATVETDFGPFPVVCEPVELRREGQAAPVTPPADTPSAPPATP